MILYQKRWNRFESSLDGENKFDLYKKRLKLVQILSELKGKNKWR